MNCLLQMTRSGCETCSVSTRGHDDRFVPTTAHGLSRVRLPNPHLRARHPHCPRLQVRRRRQTEIKDLQSKPTHVSSKLRSHGAWKTSKGRTASAGSMAKAGSNQRRE